MDSNAIDRDARLVHPARMREHFIAAHALMCGQQALAVSDRRTLAVIPNVVAVDFVAGMHRQLPRNSDQAEVICNQIERGVVVRAQANQVVEAVGPCASLSGPARGPICAEGRDKSAPASAGLPVDHVYRLRGPGGNKAYVTVPRAHCGSRKIRKPEELTTSKLILNPLSQQR